MDLVECLSSDSYPGRPAAFTWQGRRLLVTDILSRGRTPSALWFRVRSDSGVSFELEYHLPTDERQSNSNWLIKPL
jgi:hypothetical protein